MSKWTRRLRLWSAPENYKSKRDILSKKDRVLMDPIALLLTVSEMISHLGSHFPGIDKTIPFCGDILGCLVMVALVEELTAFLEQDALLIHVRTHLAAVNSFVHELPPVAILIIHIFNH